MKIVTSSGFECEIKDNAFNDYRVVKLISKIESEDAADQLGAIVELMERILPDGQEEALITYLESKAEDGIATVDMMGRELQDIMAQVTESKKN